MTERRTRRKTVETATCETLAPPPVAAPVDADPVQKLLGALYALAIEGNVSAAKLYLDYTARQRGDEPAGLTADEALLLLQEQRA
jgi:hypothetical protein